MIDRPIGIGDFVSFTAAPDFEKKFYKITGMSFYDLGVEFTLQGSNGDIKISDCSTDNWNFVMSAEQIEQEHATVVTYEDLTNGGYTIHNERGIYGGQN